MLAVQQLIEKLDLLISKSEGLIRGAYKVRRAQAIQVRNSLKRSLKIKKKRKGSGLIYQIVSNDVQGGAPGLRSQRKR